eukprot:ctg_166.g101
MRGGRPDRRGIARARAGRLPRTRPDGETGFLRAERTACQKTPCPVGSLGVPWESPPCCRKHRVRRSSTQRWVGRGGCRAERRRRARAAAGAGRRALALRPDVAGTGSERAHDARGKFLVGGKCRWQCERRVGRRLSDGAQGAAVGDKYGRGVGAHQKGRGRAQGGAVHEGRAESAAVRFQLQGGGDIELGRRALQDV